MLIVFMWYLYSTKKQLKKLGDYNLVKSLVPDVSKAKKISKFILLIFAFSSLILALCNLQTGSKTQEVKREGADIIVCLDVSNSMLAQDLSPNRLERAKYALEKMIDKLQGDRLGIIVFAGEAYVQLPITTDYGAAKLFLNSINTDMVPTQGTNIGAAIRKALEGFSKDLEKNKTIVVITDGENHEPEAVEAAAEAEKAGIVINTIGVGSEKGVPIPIMNGGVMTGYRKDKDGNTVVTKLNKAVLQEIAGKTDGIYVQATNADIGLNAILDKLAQLDKKQIDTKMYTDYEDQYQWFLGLALLFLVIEYFISERVSDWFRKFFTKVTSDKATVTGASVLFAAIMLPHDNLFAQKDKQLVYEGNNNYFSSRNIQAINNYREALKIKPDNRKAGFNLGDAIYKEAMAVKNSKDQNPIMGMKPDSLAKIMFEEAAGQFDVVSQTISDKDTLHRALHNLGNCRLMQKNYEAAVEGYKKALKVNPKDEETRYNLAYALKKLKEQQKNENKDKKDQQQQQQQQQQPQMSKEQAEQMLKAMQNKEQKLQGKKKKGEGQKVKTEKDW